MIGIKIACKLEVKVNLNFAERSFIFISTKNKENFSLCNERTKICHIWHRVIVIYAQIIYAKSYSFTKNMISNLFFLHLHRQCAILTLQDW